MESRKVNRVKRLKGKYAISKSDDEIEIQRNLSLVQDNHLIVDNYPCQFLLSKFSQIEIYYLPQNTSLILQP